jgi:hypothetical protein
MAASTRIYVVRSRLVDMDAETGLPTHRLVRAPNAAQALRHVASSTLDVEVASQEELVLLVRSGVPVEASGASGAE